MNYLDLKKRFPKSTRTFFEWVSKQNPDNQNEYVDNIYLYQFFSKYFEYRFDLPTRTIFIDEDKSYFSVLKDDIISNSSIIDYDYYISKNRIIYDKYSDTGRDFIKINVRQENEYESAFFVLEKLIENKFYEE
jgi:hypothetical protein